MGEGRITVLSPKQCGPSFQCSFDSPSPSQSPLRMNQRTLHELGGIRSRHQYIMLLGQTGSGKSTIAQYMMVDKFADVDQTKIELSVKSKTRHTEQFQSPSIHLGDLYVSFTYVDTPGFNAQDIDANTVFAEVNDMIQFTNEIHKIVVVHKMGPAQKDAVQESQKIIALLRGLGAQEHNVYICVTFAYDYNQATLNRYKAQVAELYKGVANPANIFYSYYVLLNEIDEQAHPHYIARMQSTHGSVLQRMAEPVTPFRPLMKTITDIQNAIQGLHASAPRAIPAHDVVEPPFQPAVPVEAARPLEANHLSLALHNLTLLFLYLLLVFVILGVGIGVADTIGLPSWMSTGLTCLAGIWMLKEAVTPSSPGKALVAVKAAVRAFTESA